LTSRLPSETQNIVFHLSDALQPVRYDGEDLYELIGFAFFQANPEAETKITIALTSSTQSLGFPTRSVAFPNMIESYPGYKKIMDQAEFSLGIGLAGLAIYYEQIAHTAVPVGSLEILLLCLRAHGLIRKVGKRYKYYLTGFGRQASIMALKLREMTVIPQLAFDFLQVE